MSGISNQEAVGWLDLNFELLIIDLSHAFNFSKGDCIAIIESMFFLFMEADQSSFFLGDSCNMNILALLSGSIDDLVVFSKVDESEAIET